ncbi:MAG: hypothetical protein ACOCX1_06305 [Fimbriimonadaceae bacterium]
MQRRTVQFVVGLIAASLLMAIGGCARESNVVGTYRSETLPLGSENRAVNREEQFVPAVYEFRSDGAVEISVNGQSVNGRWQIQGDRITIELPEGTSWVKPSPISFELAGGELVYQAPESDSLSVADYRLVPTDGS